MSSSVKQLISLLEAAGYAVNVKVNLEESEQLKQLLTEVLPGLLAVRGDEFSVEISFLGILITDREKNDPILTITTTSESNTILIVPQVALPTYVSDAATNIPALQEVAINFDALLCWSFFPTVPEYTMLERVIEVLSKVSQHGKRLELLYKSMLITKHLLKLGNEKFTLVPAVVENGMNIYLSYNGKVLSYTLTEDVTSTRIMEACKKLAEKDLNYAVLVDRYHSDIHVIPLEEDVDRVYILNKYYTALAKMLVPTVGEYIDKLYIELFERFLNELEKKIEKPIDISTTALLETVPKLVYAQLMTIPVDEKDLPPEDKEVIMLINKVLQG